MKLYVGLGNPGEKYSKTRHNVGYILLDEFANSAGLAWKENKKLKCVMTEHLGDYYIKPTTFMNDSGDSVSAVANFYKIKPENIIVMHDDVDLEFLRTKYQIGANSAGHHGIESIIENLGTKEFWRFRVGIGKAQIRDIATEDWVLMNFSDEELASLKTITFPR